MSEEGPKQINGLPLDMSIQNPKQISDLPDELLTDILSRVPSEQRMGIRLVNQKWNDIICDIGYHIDPLFICEESGLPYYSSTTPLRFNPVLSEKQRPSYSVRICFHSPDDKENQETASKPSGVHHLSAHQRPELPCRRAGSTQRRSWNDVKDCDADIKATSGDPRRRPD
jgi:hypothetical protein